MRIKFYVDFDVDPAIGGMQGIFFDEDSGHTHDFQELIGCKIVDMRFDDETQRTIIWTVEEDHCVKDSKEVT